MKRLLICAAILLPAAPLLSQDDAQPDARAEFKQLQAEHRKARNEFYARDRELRKQGDKVARAEFRRTNDPNAEFAPRFKRAAEKYRGKEAAVPFLHWLIQNYRGKNQEQLEWAVDTVLRDHIKSDRLSGIAREFVWVSSYLGRDRARQALDIMVNNSPHPKVKHQAMFSRVRLTMRYKDASDHDRKACLEDLKTIVKDCEVAGLKSQAKSYVYELEHLQIGMVAPEIEGEDLDGVPFKLSDYRGKVVVLDFWGDW